MSDLSKDLGNSKYALGKIAELLKRNDIEVDEIGSVKRVSLYQSLTKNEEGEAEIHDLLGIQFSPAFENGPQWPVVQPGPQVKLPPVKPRPSQLQITKPVWFYPICKLGTSATRQGSLSLPTMSRPSILRSQSSRT